jgi:stringent starvation protein B
METTRSKEKQGRLEEALSHGVAMIHLDARRPGVLVPKHCRSDFHLRLNVSWRFLPPDLSLGTWGVRETLTFGGVASVIAVPWPAIFGISRAGKESQLWLFPEDMPLDLLESAARDLGLDGGELERLKQEARLVQQPAPETPAPSTAALRAVETATERAAVRPESVPSPGRPADATPRPRHLRIVK